jgi:hypothetical protein
VFKRGEAAEVADDRLFRKCLALEGFEEVKRGRPRKVKADDEDSAGSDHAGVSSGGDRGQ